MLIKPTQEQFEQIEKYFIGYFTIDINKLPRLGFNSMIVTKDMYFKTYLKPAVARDPVIYIGDYFEDFRGHRGPLGYNTQNLVNTFWYVNEFDLIPFVENYVDEC